MTKAGKIDVDLYGVIQQSKNYPDVTLLAANDDPVLSTPDDPTPQNYRRELYAYQEAHACEEATTRHPLVERGMTTPDGSWRSFRWRAGVYSNSYMRLGIGSCVRPLSTSASASW